MTCPRVADRPFRGGFLFRGWFATSSATGYLELFCFGFPRLGLDGPEGWGAAGGFGACWLVDCIIIVEVLLVLNL